MEKVTLNIIFKSKFDFFFFVGDGNYLLAKEDIFAGDLGGGEWQRADKEVRDDHTLGKPHLLVIE